ncbi:hypothetical protein FRB94_003660 [Tulasnella sp. JGI-2019a]|nr:hypothetical protein FRB94_003660 [Tulasnella sp. JGI-2019a]KAG9027336.1 hypothetical protein FRB95_007850 [Tulasnella sp. JGI-2019a]
MTRRKSVLFVFTSTATNLLGDPTGWYLPEGAQPYYILSPTVDIAFASPEGPNPPVDPHSVDAFKSDEESQKFLGDPTVKRFFEQAIKLEDVDADEYDAIFYVGGHGPMIDLVTNTASINLVNAFYRSKKPTAAVCHGPGAFVNATDSNNEPIFKGRCLTGFSNVEEEQAGKTDAVPFLLEDRITSDGGTYEKADAPWGEKVVVDGHLITGQNPASARAVGQAILEALK